MPNLKTDYKELEYDIDNGYENAHLLVINNGDGTVSFRNMTQYRNSGQYDSVKESNKDYINADDINTTNAAVNSLASRYSLWIGSYTALPTNFVNAQYNGRKKYTVTELGNNKITLTDRTTYTVNGSAYGATQINSTNTLINSLTLNYESGYNRLITFLKTNGASSDNLIEALQEMESAQINNGFERGIQDVKSNPSAYDCHTQSEVNSLNAQSNNYRTSMRNVAAAIAQYKPQLIAQAQNSAAQLSSINETLNDITAGISKQTATVIAQLAINNGNSLRTSENSSVSTYQSNCATYAQQLGV